MMDQDVFDDWAYEHDIAADSYSIGKDQDDAYCVVELRKGLFMVYFSERGNRLGAVEVIGEEVALSELKRRILADESTTSSFATQHRGPHYKSH